MGGGREREEGKQREERWWEWGNSITFSQRDIRNIVWDMVDILQQPKIVWVMETLRQWG